MSLRLSLLVLACAAALPLQAKPSITLIGAVQGEGAQSPLLGQTVTVEGRLSADLRDGLDGF
jgi:uncharacterized protein